MTVYVITEFVEYEGHSAPRRALSSPAEAEAAVRELEAQWLAEWRGRHPEDAAISDTDLQAKRGPDFRIEALEVE